MAEDATPAYIRREYQARIGVIDEKIKDRQRAIRQRQSERQSVEKDLLDVSSARREKMQEFVDRKNEQIEALEDEMFDLNAEKHGLESLLAW